MTVALAFPRDLRRTFKRNLASLTKDYGARTVLCDDEIITLCSHWLIKSLLAAVKQNDHLGNAARIEGDYEAECARALGLLARGATGDLGPDALVQWLASAATADF